MTRAETILLALFIVVAVFVASGRGGRLNAPLTSSMGIPHSASLAVPSGRTDAAVVGTSPETASGYRPVILSGASPSSSAAVTRTPSPATPKPTQLSDGGAVAGGLATWYRDGDGLYGAVPSWHWRDPRYRVRVCLADGSRCVVVTVRDFCQCKGARLIDLSAAAFSRLAPLSRGVIRVYVVMP